MLIEQSCKEDGPLVFGIDETIARRRGAKITAKGIYRDPARSSHSHFVKCSGLRWMCLMLLTTVPWAGCIWALPFLTALAPSERYCKQHRKRHKKSTEWARQMIKLLARWSADRKVIIVADSSYSALELLATVKKQSNFDHPAQAGCCPVRVRARTSWYQKKQPTFADAIAAVRRQL